MKKIGLVFALVVLLLLHCAIVSAKQCVKWETEVYECGTTWAPADGDPLTKGPWYPVPLWCERKVCVEWAKSDQPSKEMFASDDSNCVCAECGKKCGTGHETSCSSYQKPKAKSDTTSKSLLCSFLYAAENREEVTVTGTLVMIAAIGGETTGWGIELDSPLTIEGKTLHVIEIDMMGKKINLLAFKGDNVKVIGNLVKRHGIERGEYWVIEVRTFSW
jgi:hypothetical protein